MSPRSFVKSIWKKLSLFRVRLLTCDKTDVTEHRSLTLGPMSLAPVTSKDDSVAPLASRDCGICLEKFVAGEFPHRCIKCTNGSFCANCLKDWFIDACKDESKMPPKCCSAIPLSTISNLLTTVQVCYLGYMEVNKLTKTRWSFIRPNTKNGTLPIASTVLYQHARLSSHRVCTSSKVGLTSEREMKIISKV